MTFAFGRPTRGRASGRVTVDVIHDSVESFSATWEDDDIDVYASASFGDASWWEQSVECRHRSSKSLSAQLTRGFPSLALTSLWRSHTHRDRDARESTRGGDASTSTRKSARHVAHGYKSPSASKNRRACTRCVAVGTSWAEGRKGKQRRRQSKRNAAEARRRRGDAGARRAYRVMRRHRV